MFKLLRVHQYVKNLFIFAPMMFAFEFSIPNIIDSAIAFILFSLLSSSIYVLNDLMDVTEDRQHPLKKLRPIASGQVSRKQAVVIMLLLSALSLSITYLFDIQLFMVLAAYFLLQVAYSFKLKHITIVDIFIIAAGFILRLFAGASVTDISLSKWIIIMTFLLALFLAVAKRRDDVILQLKGRETRKNIEGYNLEFVNAVMVFMAGVIVVAYILYTISDEVIQRLQSDYLYVTALFVILGIVRYMQITFVEQKSGNPTRLVLKDIFLQLTILFWLISFWAVTLV